MLRFEEIRDIIENNVYIGSGSVLGVSDAAHAILSRLTEAQASAEWTCGSCGSTVTFGVNGERRCGECGEKV